MRFSIYDLCNSFERKISENKSISLDFVVVKDWTEFFEFRVKCTRKIDHAGAELNLSIVGFELWIGLYDHRHWNDDENRWTLPGESADIEYIKNMEVENG